MGGVKEGFTEDELELIKSKGLFMTHAVEDILWKRAYLDLACAADRLQCKISNGKVKDV